MVLRQHFSIEKISPSCHYEFKPGKLKMLNILNEETGDRNIPATDD